jgi:peptidoglycan LD-endopeptidase CwlK
MINSRDIAALHPQVVARARAFIEACQAQGIDILVTSTYRDHASQDALYALGRSKPGKKVTHAKGGQSFHNFRVAFDIAPLRAGKPVWGTAGEDGQLWARIGAIGEAQGLEWAGRWERMREMAHFQFTGGLTLKDFQAGRHLP